MNALSLHWYLHFHCLPLHPHPLHIQWYQQWPDPSYPEIKAKRKKIKANLTKLLLSRWNIIKIHTRYHSYTAWCIPLKEQEKNGNQKVRYIFLISVWRNAAADNLLATHPSYKGKVIFLEYIVTKNGTFKEVENEFGMKNQPFQFNRIIPNSKPRETKTLSKPW